MARASVRQLWAKKLAGSLDSPSLTGPARSARRVSSGEAVSRAVVRVPYEGLVLGIDPSLRGTGLALVDFRRGAKPLLLHSRTVKIGPRIPFATALGLIAKAVEEVLTRSTVRHVAVEQAIYVQNVRTAQILGSARGAALCVAGARDIDVFEYPPLRIKQAVVGIGSASKEQMARTVRAHFGHGASLGFDEADAAGAALCHAFTWRE